jgi:cell division protein FtsN
MIDRDDQDSRDTGDQDHMERDHESEEAAQGPSDGNSEEAVGEAEPDTDAPADASPEEQPAMSLEGGSDEGGTIEDETHEADEDASAADSADEPAEEAPVEEFEDESAFEGEDLGLVSDDDSLPWLESSDYDDIESVDAWRITGFVVMGLVVLALLIGGIWYFTNRDDVGAPVADGSTIAAPDTPYKERPEDPGGKTFEGTGDMAPAVGEGESREGRLAEKSATPEPVAPEPAAPAEERAEAPKPAAGNDNRIAVQVGAYRDTATAEQGWRQLSRQTDALSGVEYRIVKGEADIGTVYRLQALPGDMAAARRLADALKADGVASQIKQ